MTCLARRGGDPLGQRLRETCRPLHAQLDGLPTLASLATRTPRRDDYLGLLGAMAGVVPVLEHALGEALPRWRLGDWVPALNRTRPLAADCRALGLRASAELPPARLDSRESCLAALYVLEGSRLGGKMMARNLRHGGHEAALPLSFLAVAAPAPLGWPALLGLLGDCAGDSAEATRACALASGIFEHLLRTLHAATTHDEAPT